MPLPQMTVSDPGSGDNGKIIPKRENKTAMLCFMVSLWLAVLTVIGAGAVYILAWLPVELDALFDEPMGDVWNHNNTCLTEIEGVKYIGWVVWALQIIWLVYVMTFLCRGDRQVRLYDAPPLFPAPIPLIVLFACILHIVWTLLFSRGDMAAFGVIALIVASGLFHTALIISAYKLYVHEGHAEELGFQGDTWAIRIFVHNLLGGLASYTMLVVFLNMAQLTADRSSLTNEYSCYINLGFMFVYVIIFYAADLATLRHMRHTFVGPYLVMLAMVGAILYKHRHSTASPENINLMVAGALAGIIVLFLLFKMIIYVARFGRGAPPPRGKKSKTKGPNSWEELSSRAGDSSIRPDSLYREKNAKSPIEEEDVSRDIFKTPIYSSGKLPFSNKRPIQDTVPSVIIATNPNDEVRRNSATYRTPSGTTVVEVVTDSL